MTSTDKPAMRSKKFKAFLMVEVMLFIALMALIGLAPETLTTTTVMHTIIICITSIGALYLGGVAALDSIGEVFRKRGE
jgi:1,4-dihydroxy-2-naphthoate octaprenyltransferase